MTALLRTLASIFYPHLPVYIDFSHPVVPSSFLSYLDTASIDLSRRYPTGRPPCTVVPPQTPVDTTKAHVTSDCPVFKVTMGTTTGRPAIAWVQTCWSGWALGSRSTPRSTTCGRRVATNWTTAPTGPQAKNRRRVTSVRQWNLSQPEGPATDKGKSTTAWKQPVGLCSVQLRWLLDWVRLQMCTPWRSTRTSPRCSLL
jgi:hypothetical protein